MPGEDDDWGQLGPRMPPRPADDATPKRNRLREIRIEILDAIQALVVESKTASPVERALILRETASGIAALENSQSQWLLARMQIETERRR